MYHNIFEKCHNDLLVVLKYSLETWAFRNGGEREYNLLRVPWGQLKVSRLSRCPAIFYCIPERLNFLKFIVYGCFNIVKGPSLYLERKNLEIIVFQKFPFLCKVFAIQLLQYGKCHLGPPVGVWIVQVSNGLVYLLPDMFKLILGCYVPPVVMGTR